MSWASAAGGVPSGSKPAASRRGGCPARRWRAPPRPRSAHPIGGHVRRREQAVPGINFAGGFALRGQHRRVGELGHRRGAGDAQRPHLPGARLLKHRAGGGGHHLDAPGHHLGDHLRPGAEGHVHHLQPVPRRELGHHQVAGRAGTDRAVIQLARIGARMRDQLGKASRGQRRVHRQHEGLPRQQRHRAQLAHGIVAQRRVQQLGDGAGATDGDAQRVSVGGAGHRLGADHAAAARAVLHYHRLAQHRLEMRRQRAGDDVGRGATGKADHDPHRAVRPGGLRQRGRGEQRQCERGAATDHDAAVSPGSPRL
jgi:hypothetical protein